ncbi:MAG: hypothetical protein J1E85_07025 [Ruminococcus sp.]|nr:hypothetical protein [Ruminococcus sp.]
MNNFGNFRCSCGSENITCSIEYDGCDWKSEEGKGSGFDYEISLACKNCGRVYPIGRLKSEHDFSQIRNNK